MTEHSRCQPQHATSTSDRRVVLAPVFGYCWGVRRTLALLEQAAITGPIATVGDVIHNPQVVNALRDRGIEPVGSVAEAAARGFRRVATTAHGAGPGRAQTAQEAGLEYLDLTCPLVARVQRLAVKLAEQGYYLVVYGDAVHPEVRGILAWAGTSRACAALVPESVPWLTNGYPPHKVAIISQTTKTADGFAAFAERVVGPVIATGGEARVVNTICRPTRARQHAVAYLARSGVDLVLVIGGRKSSNTARLVEVARHLGLTATRIESANEVNPSLLGDARIIGITAGASTPDDVIAAVIDRLATLGYAPPVWPSHHDEAEDDDGELA